MVSLNSDADTDVDKVNSRNNCQPLHEKKITILTVMIPSHCVISVREFFCDQSQENQ